MPDSRDLLAALIIVVLVGLLPWIAGLWPGASLFGFPWPAFVPLLAMPVFFIVLVRGAGASDDPTDEDEA